MSRTDNQNAHKEICPNCGRVFYCSRTDECWCSKIPVPRLLLEDLDTWFDHCLCPECLVRMIRDHQSNRPLLHREDLVFQWKKGSALDE